MSNVILTNKKKVLLCVIDELSKKGKSSRFMIEKNLFLQKMEEKLAILRHIWYHAQML